ncbi:MAG: hypothetical protein ACK4UJ_07585 [Leptonema sp. (in: bacteria)]
MWENLKQKGLLWRLLNSWHILLTFFMGLLSWITFFYMYSKGKKKSWLYFGFIYLIAVIALIYITTKYPDEKTRPDFVDYFIYSFIILWLFSIFYAIYSLQEFWLRIQTYETIKEQTSLDLETSIKKELGAIDNPVDQTLSEFKETDVSVKLLKFLFDNIPFTPEFYYYMDLKRAIKRYREEFTEEFYQEVRKIAKFNENIQKILKTAKAMDKIDSGLGIFTGLKNGYEIFTKKQKGRTYEADPQQAMDAGIKAVALGYMISLTSKDDPIKTFLEIKAGQELLYYFITVELALPFTDNLIESGSEFLYKLLQEKEKEISSRFISFTDKNSYQEARSILSTFSDKIDQMVLIINQNIKRLEDSFSNQLPRIMNITDSTTGGIATVLDLMPIWKLLGARVAAEICVYKALSNQ